MENLLSVLPMGAEVYFYRTAAGAEIDLIIKLSSSELWAIEIKNGTLPKVPRGFHQACEDLAPTRKYIVYGGDDEFPIQNNTVIISLRKMMEKLWQTP